MVHHRNPRTASKQCCSAATLQLSHQSAALSTLPMHLSSTRSRLCRLMLLGGCPQNPAIAYNCYNQKQRESMTKAYFTYIILYKWVKQTVFMVNQSTHPRVSGSPNQDPGTPIHPEPGAETSSRGRTTLPFGPSEQNVPRIARGPGRLERCMDVLLAEAHGTSGVDGRASRKRTRRRRCFSEAETPSNMRMFRSTCLFLFISNMFEETSVRNCWPGGGVRFQEDFGASVKRSISISLLALLYLLQIWKTDIFWKSKLSYYAWLTCWRVLV